MMKAPARALVGLTVLVCLGVGGYAGQAWWARRVAAEIIRNRVQLWSGKRIESLPTEEWIDLWRQEPCWGRWGRDPETESPSVWNPASRFRECLCILTGQDFRFGPDEWAEWLGRHPGLAWDPARNRFVSRVEESVTYGLPEGAREVPVLRPMRLSGFYWEAPKWTALRSEQELLTFLALGPDAYTPETVALWNGIDFGLEMALVVSPGSGWDGPKGVWAVFEWRGDLCFADVVPGADYVTRTPVNYSTFDAGFRHPSGVVIARSEKQVRFIPRVSLPKRMTRTVLYPDVP